MSRRASAHAVASLLIFSSALALPAIGAASSGGSGIAPSPSSAPGPSRSGGVQSGSGTVSASGGGITIETRASAFLSNQLRFSGNAPAAFAGKIVQIQRLGHETGWSWASTAQSRVAPDGSFSVLWHTNHIGRFSVRAVIAGAASARAAASSPTVTVTVYRSSVATQYGPGFWGHRTACGQVLTPHTLGTANRTLRCGTPVAIYYRGRTIVVPVIDRGPYANGADWDLTQATGRALGIGGTATIGAVSLPSR